MVSKPSSEKQESEMKRARSVSGWRFRTETPALNVIMWCYFYHTTSHRVVPAGADFLTSGPYEMTPDQAEGSSYLTGGR